MKTIIIFFSIFLLITSCRESKEFKKLNLNQTTDKNIIENSRIKFNGSYILNSSVNNKGHYSSEKPNFCAITFYKNGEFKRSANYYISSYEKIDSLESAYKERINKFRNKELRCVYNIIKADSVVAYELYKYVRHGKFLKYNVATFSLSFINDTIYVSENNNLLLDNMKLFYVPNIIMKKE